MKNVLLVILQIAFFLCSWTRTVAQPKEEITIVITDSGLGGLSVVEDVAKKIKVSGCFKKVNLIFVNALFDSNTGYNALQTRDEKIRIFNNVLAGIDEHFRPDVILIACNTLSVLYKETDFVKKSKTTIFGIVEPGVQLVAERLLSDSTSSVILFGTETTIDEASHLKALMALKIAGNRIISKSCPQLQSFIEQDPHGEETEMLISVYLNEALEQLPKTNGTVYLSLNCSHFGYSEDLWRKAFATTSFKFGAVLDPNFRMADFLINEICRNKFSETTLSYLVVSKIELLNDKVMVQYFSKKAPELAKALQNYRLMPALFK
jgi:glutamate racemase